MINPKNEELWEFSLVTNNELLAEKLSELFELMYLSHHLDGLHSWGIRKLGDDE
jgi:hypothetical protein